jgi:small subunit ribosomal protein S6
LADNLYEGMFLLDSGQFAANPEGATGQLLGILEKAGATIVAHRPWQDGKLAYEIEGQRKGLHYLVLYKQDPEKTPEVTRACKLNELVLRHLVIRQPETIFEAMVAALSSDTRPYEDESAESEGSAEETDKAEVGSE